MRTGRVPDTASLIMVGMTLSSASPKSSGDIVDSIVADWARERADLDVVSLGIFSRLTRIAKRLDLVRKRVFAESGLELWEFDVLAALRRAGEPHSLSPKRLLESNLVSSGTMTNRIARLSERGLVTRSEDPADGRGVIVTMTDAGRERVDAAMTLLVAAERELLDELSDEERATLSSALRGLLITMEHAQA